jgi:hypothetical protein
MVVVGKRAWGETLEVGPNKRFSSIEQALNEASAGDLVLVYGGPSYSELTIKRGGTGEKPITIRGVRTNGQRPKIAGGANTIHVQANHIIIEGFDISGGSARCIFHHGHDLTISDSVVHDCANHGILGADEDSGSLLLDRVELYACGNSTNKHPIYIATDEKTHPGSVFRMQHYYVHDSRGGNNVKSRAERNEIYYNWIEGAVYHELELIGPDGQPPELKREDSDVVGNVFRKLNDSYVVRIGGDGTGETNGRYRFANNTFLLGKDTRAVFRIFDGIESVEMINNVFYRLGGGPITVTRTTEAKWAAGAERIAGNHNWIPTGSERIPSSWTATLTGSDPGFVSIDALDLRPAKGSVLIDASGSLMPSGSEYEIVDTLRKLSFSPARRSIEMLVPRGASGSSDIGAYEAEADLAGRAPKSSDDSGAPTLISSAKVTPGAAGAASGRCGCRLGDREVWEQGPGYVVLVALGLGLRKRRKRLAK